MTVSAPKFRRRHYFIKKSFQFKFIFRFCLLLFAGVLISTALLFLFSQDTLTSSFSHSKLVIEKTSFAIMPVVIYTNLITLALISIASIFVTLLVSHKLAGPMYRFETDLKIIGQGDLTKVVRLREYDQLREFVNSINEMTGNLQSRMAEIKNGVGNLRKTVSLIEVPVQLTQDIENLEQKVEANFKI